MSDAETARDRRQAQGGRPLPTWPAWLTLLLLAPAMGELLSGSAPPAEFFQPLALAGLVALYGCGALLVRELSLRPLCDDSGAGRVRVSWLSVFLLGAAYAIIEEGLIVRSFFRTDWPDLGPLAHYGRWAGANWMWILLLTIYHTCFSIASPILIAELIFPALRRRRWLSRRGMVVAAAVFAANWAAMAAFFRCQVPGRLMAASAAAVAALAAVAWRVGRKPPPARATDPSRVPRPAWFFATGLLATAIYFLVFFVLPQTALPPAAAVFLLLCAAAVTAAILWRVSGAGAAWNDLHRFALVAGPLVFFALLAFVQEADNPNRPDNTAGMSLVGLAFLSLTLWLHRRTLRATVKEPNNDTGMAGPDLREGGLP